MPKKTSEHPLDTALAHFKKADPVLYRACIAHESHLRENITPTRKRKSETVLFQKLAMSIVSQQLSTKAADTIWGRLETACKGSVTPEAISRIRETAMRKVGLSQAKVKTLKGLAKAVTSKTLSLSSLYDTPEEEAVATLSAHWGVGTWTAEMFLMFALERDDVFSPGDLGLRRAIETLYGVAPTAHIRELEEIARVWSPHRTIACRVLWRSRDAK